MRILIVALLVLAFSFSGCAYNKQTLMRLAGDEVHVPLGPLESITGSGLTAMLYRNVSIAYGNKDPINEFKNIRSTDSTSADGSSETIDVN